jgi:hypothetical protein
LCDDSDEPESFDVYCTKGDESKREAFVKTVMGQQTQIVQRIKQAMDNIKNMH